jgi:undecaprenyl diphosphate synthase
MYSIFDKYHPSKRSIPNHVGIIPDGSRRWAIKNCISYYESYDMAMQNTCQIIELLYNMGINIISLYFSSSQNFERPVNEIEAFCKAESNFCNCYILPVIQKNDVHVDYYGNDSFLPLYFLESLNELKLRTKECTSKQLNLCVSYNPFVELWESIKKSNSPDSLLNNLWISSPVDLIIRTGKANLVSNFLLLQSGFARLYFPNKLINDLCQEDIKGIIDDFIRIERKYGE